MEIQNFEKPICEQLENSRIYYLVRTDLEGKYTYTNPLFKEKFSFISDNFIGQLFPDTIHQDDVEKCSQAAYFCITHPGENTQLQIRKPDSQGGFYWTNWEFSGLCNPQGEVIELLCIGYDITESELSRLTTQEYARRIDEILESITDSFFAITQEGVFTYINNSFELATGKSREAIIGKYIWEIFPETVNSEFQRACKQALLAKESKYVEEYQAGAKKWFSFAIYPSREGLSVYFQDITSRKVYDEKLREQELHIRKYTERLRIATETAQIGIWEWDLKQKRVIWNDKLLEIYGIYHQDLEEDFTLWQTFIHPDDIASIQKELRKVLSEAKELHDVRFRIIREDGEIRYNEASAKPVFDPHGDLIYIIGANVDITDLIRAHEDLKQNNEKIRKLNTELELRVAERTSALEASNQDLEAFAYSISHDLRAPLRRINGFANLLEKQMQESDLLKRRYLEAISKSSRQLYQMISDLLDFSRIGRKEIKKKQMDLNQIVQEVLEILSNEIEHRIIHWKIETLPPIWGDVNMIKRVFENLLSNAIKFTSQKKIAKIEIGSQMKNDQTLEIFIKDNGVGFDMNYYHKLFGVFQRLHGEDEYPGTGIGLVNVKRIVNRHGGDIRGEGKMGEGAIFYITLPIKKSQKNE